MSYHARARLSRTDVESLALRRWSARKTAPDSYWVTTAQAAPMLGVIPTRVRQLANAELLPFEVGPGDQRLYRRAQVEVIARARRARFGPPAERRRAYDELMDKVQPRDPYLETLLERLAEVESGAVTPIPDSVVRASLTRTGPDADRP